MRGIKIFTTHILWLNQWSLKTGPRPARTRKFLSGAELGVSRHCAAVLRCHWNTGNYLTISCWHIERLFKTFPFIQLYGHEHSDGFRLIPGWGFYLCCFAIFTNSGCFGRKVWQDDIMFSPSLALMAPAVTPWDSSTPTDPRFFRSFWTSSLRIVSMYFHHIRNPGLRLFQFEQETGRCIKFFPSNLNLSAGFSTSSSFSWTSPKPTRRGGLNGSWNMTSLTTMVSWPTA